MSVIGAYAPQSEDPSCAYARSHFWTSLHNLLRRLPFRSLRLLLIDANAHVEHSPPVVGPCGSDVCNSNGHSRLHLCHSHDIMLTNTWRPGLSSEWTWQSTDKKTRKKIDFIGWSRVYKKCIACNVGVDLSLRFSLLSFMDHRPVSLLVRVPTVSEHCNRFVSPPSCPRPLVSIDRANL